MTANLNSDGDLPLSKVSVGAGASPHSSSVACVESCVCGCPLDCVVEFDSVSSSDSAVAGIAVDTALSDVNNWSSA